MRLEGSGRNLQDFVVSVAVAIHIIAEVNAGESRRFDELRSRATVIELEGRSFFVSSLDDLIAMKEAAGRPQDLLDVAELKRLRHTERERLFDLAASCGMSRGTPILREEFASANGENFVPDTASRILWFQAVVGGLLARDGSGALGQKPQRRATARRFVRLWLIKTRCEAEPG